MSRSLSSVAQQAIHAQQTGEEFIILLTIAHADITTIYVANSTKDIVNNGNTHIAYPFQISLPEDTADRPPEVELIIDNVDRQIIDAVRTISDPPTITMIVVLGSDPDTTEAGPFAFTLQNARWNSFTVTGRLSFEAILDEPFPAGTFNPAEFEGLFK